MGSSLGIDLSENEINLLPEGTHVVCSGLNLRMSVRQSGVRSWSVGARFEGKPYTRGLGAYPEISLDDAKDRAAEMRIAISSGEIPDAYNPNALADRKFAAVRAYQSGTPHHEVAKQFGVTDATVFRWVRQAKEDLERARSVQSSLKGMAQPPWIRIARKDLEATSAMFAIEFANRFYPLLIRANTMDDQLAAIRQAFVETVEDA